MLHSTLAIGTHSTLSGLDANINPNSLPKNFPDAMSSKDKQLWEEAFSKEFVGFQDRKVFKIVRPEPGKKILHTLTRMEYKEDNGKFVKCKLCLVVRRDQHVAGKSFNEIDLYSPVLKATEASLLLAIAAEQGCKVRMRKTDTHHSFLYWDIGDDVVYIKPPDWRPEPVPEGHCLQLIKNVYSDGTRQAAH
jgi:hypothetical protein